MKNGSATRSKLVPVLFLVVPFLALGAALGGATARFSSRSPSASRSVPGLQIPPPIANGITQVGPKRFAPLGPFERPELNLQRVGLRAVSRAIAVQNVDLTPDTPSDQIDPVWSPDGTQILFSSNGEDSNRDGKIDRVRADGTFHIWLMNPDGSNQRQITTDPGNQIEPAWSPNGLRIAYASSEGGDYDIYLLTLPAGPKKRLSLGTSEERHPTWAAGGDRVAFYSDRTGLPKIWSMRADGTVPQMLSSDGPSDDRNPVWSPDGQWIAFQSNGTDTNGDGTIDGAANAVNIWVMSHFGSQQRPITAFTIQNVVLTNKDAAWDRAGLNLVFSSDRKDTNGDGVPDARGDFDAYVLPFGQPETPTTTNARQLTQRSPTEFNALTGDEENPSLYPDQARDPKVLFSENQTGSRHIWLTSIQDITQPRLTEIPSVTPRTGSIPGDTVTITARVQDLESGVQAVYAQFRDPDDSVTDALRQEHKVYFHQNDNMESDQTTNPFSIWTEVDCHMVHATDYTYHVPPYQPPVDDFSQALPPSPGWLRLWDDGQHNDGAANDGLYGNTWRTPTNAPSDFLADIIAYDAAGNWKIYDGLAGFTTEQFTATHGVLLVMDYAHGQKFMQSDRGRFGAGFSFWPTWFPVESYYTHNPTGSGVNPAQYSENIVGPTPATNIGSGAVPTFSRGLPEEGYDLWRVVCRGRVPPDVIAAYTPRTVEQPDFQNPYGTTPRLQTVADRCIFWVAPYAGDLWVSEGTLVDADTQSKLVDFLSKGGRLVVTGQDVAWALTRDGKATSALLDRMGVQYVDDASAQAIGGGVDLRRFVDWVETNWGLHPGDNQLHIPVNFTVNGPVVNPVRGNIYASIGIASSSTRETGNHCDTDAAGNQFWIDSILPVAPATTAFDYASNVGVGGRTDGIAAVRKVDTTTTARSVFFAFGIEGVHREYVPPAGEVGMRRHYLVHNAICWMRTGTIYGTATFTAGLGPAKGALVRALQGNTVVGQAFTRVDGTYEIQGLPSGVYQLEAIYPGFTFDHAQPGVGIHGAGSGQRNFRLSEAPPGSISGRVVQPDGVTPVPGATITVTLQGLYKGEAVEKSTQTDQFGVYSVADLPTGLYQVKATAEGFTDQVYPALVTVNPGADSGGVNFVMGGMPGSITGTVTRESDGQPVSGATVELRSGQTLVAQTTTDQSGRYAFTNVSPGTYDIVVTSGTGILPTTVTVVVAANAQVRKNVVARTPPPAQVAGMVRDSAGNPVSGATIEAVADGKVVRTVFSGDVQQEGSVTYNYKLTSLPAGTYELRASKTGYRGGTTRVTVQEGQQLFNVNFTLEALHVFSSGLWMVSTAYDYADQDVGNLLGLPPDRVKLANWVGTRYAFYPEAPADRLRLGLGYFMLLDAPVSLSRQGRAADTTRPYALRVSPGWNMIGNPFPYIVNWFDTKVDTGSEVLTLQDAITRDLVKNALWTYSNGQYRLAFQLVPWEGYWVKATQDVTLLISNVAGRSAAPDPYRTRTTTEESWTLQLGATAGRTSDTYNYLGVAREARDGYDTATDVLEAPPTGMADWVQLTFPHRTGWGRDSGDYAVDMRTPVSGEKTWDFEVRTNLPNTDVVLRWPNAGQLPRRYTAVLEDLDTGARRYLRSSPGYTFRSAPEGGARRFRLRVTTQAAGRLVVSGLKVVPNRGGALLGFDLSDAATVRVRIADPAGKVVREVASGYVAQPGTNQIPWDGRDSRGRGLAYGLYLYQVEATAEDGRTVLETRVFVHVR